MIIKGKVHKLGDNINTDDIIAAKYLDSQDESFLGSKCMENIDPQFVHKVSKGDIIVAGKNFGCGSSREHAPLAIKGCGISLVIAKSFARIFYRNCINLGLPILVFSQTEKIDDGDELNVDLSQGIIKNINKGEEHICEKFPLFMREIINSGGLIEWIKKKEE
ncbi:MAG: 3-isopropylmalate dehydratase small subunit [Candidatus Omnitrophica bacterium]|nr:3-isopropylmalate dehydratase small subunit [Candidatus Omnitrophota bacterium]MCM8826922.1 3-isopropylmalate dehydratase small subunit [Candidatus Omnitrophota bacterium]